MYQIIAQTGRARVGMLRTRTKLLETPFLLVGSSRGIIPHIPFDIQCEIDGLDAVGEVFAQICENNGDTLIQKLGRTIHTHIYPINDDQAIPAVFLRIRDPFEFNFEGNMNEKFVTVISGSGRMQITPEKFINSCGILRPDIAVAPSVEVFLSKITDEGINKEKRIKKANEYTLKYLDQILLNQQQDNIQSLGQQTVASSSSQSSSQQSSQTENSQIQADKQIHQLLNDIPLFGVVLLQGENEGIWMNSVQETLKRVKNDQKSEKLLKDTEIIKQQKKETQNIGIQGVVIGGLNLGESSEQRKERIRKVMPLLDPQLPRVYVGSNCADDIIFSIIEGIDIIDSSFPLLMARRNQLLTFPLPYQMHEIWKQSNTYVNKKDNKVEIKENQKQLDKENAENELIEKSIFQSVSQSSSSSSSSFQAFNYSLNLSKNEYQLDTRTINDVLGILQNEIEDINKDKENKQGIDQLILVDSKTKEKESDPKKDMEKDEEKEDKCEDHQFGRWGIEETPNQKRNTGMRLHQNEKESQKQQKDECEKETSQQQERKLVNKRDTVGHNTLAYIHHLINVDEMNGKMIIHIHNIQHTLNMISEVRQMIKDGFREDEEEKKGKIKLQEEIIIKNEENGKDQKDRRDVLVFLERYCEFLRDLRQNDNQTYE